MHDGAITARDSWSSNHCAVGRLVPLPITHTLQTSAAGAPTSPGATCRRPAALNEFAGGLSFQFVQQVNMNHAGRSGNPPAYFDTHHQRGPRQRDDCPGVQHVEAFRTRARSSTTPRVHGAVVTERRVTKERNRVFRARRTGRGNRAVVDAKSSGDVTSGVQSNAHLSIDTTRRACTARIAHQMAEAELRGPGAAGSVERLATAGEHQQSVSVPSTGSHGRAPGSVRAETAACFDPKRVDAGPKSAAGTRPVMRVTARRDGHLSIATNTERRSHIAGKRIHVPEPHGLARAVTAGRDRQPLFIRARSSVGSEQPASNRRVAGSSPAGPIGRDR